MVVRKSGVTVGLACMFAYVALYVGTNMLTRLLAPSLPLMQIALFRYGFAIPAILFVMVASGKAAFRIKSTRVHVTRGVLAAVGSICGYAAIATLPLGDATALFFTAPLLVTAGAALLLREQAGKFRLICIAGGFFGVLMIARPNLGSASGVLAGLANAICAALGVLLVRHFRNTEGALALALTTSIVCVAALAFPACLEWKSASPVEFLMLVALGVMGGGATILLNVAYRMPLPPCSQASTIWLCHLAWRPVSSFGRSFSGHLLRRVARLSLPPGCSASAAII